MIRPSGQVIILSQGSKRDHGRKAQLANIQAGKSIADIVRTTLGPNSLLKMLIDPMGGIVITNDGNAILREIDVSHPAAKSLIELSRAQDEEVGDGTTSVVVITGEILALSESVLQSNIHPISIVAGFHKALEDILACLDKIAIVLDLNDKEKLLEVIAASMSTKFSSHWSNIVTHLALDAAKTVVVDRTDGVREVEIKRYVRLEKIPGGTSDDCQVISGIMINKDVTHGRMRRLIRNPRVVLLDCPLEYKKGESQTNVEVTKEEDWEKLLKQEEDEVQKTCSEIIAVGCDVVVTEKGVSDLAQHFLMKAGISVIRRVKKTDNVRLAKVTGAIIVNRTEELTSNDVGHKCGLFKVDKIGDEYYAYFVECQDAKACTVVLRGGSKDVLNEVERNFQDAVNVARNILLEGKLLPGGGATEMELSYRMQQLGLALSGPEQAGYRCVAQALEVIPKTLAQNCGADVVRTMTELRAKHAAENATSHLMGINGVTGQIVNVTEVGIWDTYAVKAQLLKTAIECASMVMRVDDVLSGISRKKEPEPQVTNYPQEGNETFGDARDG